MRAPPCSLTALMSYDNNHKKINVRSKADRSQLTQPHSMSDVTLFYLFHVISRLRQSPAQCIRSFAFDERLYYVLNVFCCSSKVVLHLWLWATLAFHPFHSVKPLAENMQIGCDETTNCDIMIRAVFVYISALTNIQNTQLKCSHQHRFDYFASRGVRSIAIVLHVCLSVCALVYVKNYIPAI